MGIKYGRLLICDRCGRTAFEKVQDNNPCKSRYECEEEGWDYSHIKPDKITLCPHCSALRRSMNNGFIEGCDVHIPAVDETQFEGGVKIDREKERAT